MKTAVLLIAASVPMLQAQPPSEVVTIPSASDVIARLMERDAARQAALAGYTATRRYTLDNKSRHASMVVRATVESDGTRNFTIVEESGSGVVRKHVFHKILEGESAASTPQMRAESQICPQNYSFRSVGVDSVNDRRAFVIELTPRNESKYLIAGRIWVDTKEYAVLRVEGKPAKNPSFWTKSVHFVHDYQKNGAFWFPASNRSETEARIFGRTDLTIEYFDYAVNSQRLASSFAPKVAK
jgi:negative regulator of sigma E activity